MQKWQGLSQQYTTWKLSFSRARTYMQCKVRNSCHLNTKKLAEQLQSRLKEPLRQIDLEINRQQFSLLKPQKPILIRNKPLWTWIHSSRGQWAIWSCRKGKPQEFQALLRARKVITKASQISLWSPSNKKTTPDWKKSRSSSRKSRQSMICFKKFTNWTTTRDINFSLSWKT